MIYKKFAVAVIGFVQETAGGVTFGVFGKRVNFDLRGDFAFDCKTKKSLKFS
jgi:hypothetical protein